MLQPELFDKFMDRKGGDLRELGLFARFLICRPESLAGQRFDDGADQSTHFLNAFKRRGRELMLHSYRVMCGEEQPREIRFMPEAERLWFEIHNDIESRQQPGGQFEGMRDHASKMMDIISRIAACLHLFEGYKVGVSEQTLYFAKEICLHSADYCGSQFVRPPESIRDAIYINNLLNRECRVVNVRWVKSSDLRSSMGPKGLRRAARYNPALYQLKSEGLIAEWHQKTDGRKTILWIDVFPGNPLNTPDDQGEWYRV